MTPPNDAEKAAYCLLCDDTHENSSCKTSTGATIRKLMDERDALKAELERMGAVVEAAKKAERFLQEVSNQCQHGVYNDACKACEIGADLEEKLAALERGGDE